MTPVQRAIADCLATPRADAARLALADALQRANDVPAAEFVRGQVRVAVARRAAGERTRAVEREAAGYFPPQPWITQVAAPVEAWLGAHRKGAAGIAYTWGRGLPEAATVEAQALADDGETLRARMPLLDLTVRNVQAVGPTFFDLPVLTGLRSLQFEASRASLPLIEALCACPFLTELRVLDLHGLGLPASVLDALAASPFLRKLRYARLDGNTFPDPNPTADEDYSGLRGAHPSAAGAALAARHGALSWLPGFPEGYAPVPETFGSAS